MRNLKVSFIPIFFRQKVAKPWRQFFHKSSGKSSGHWFGRESGGPACVSETVMNMQNCTKIEYKISNFYFASSRSIWEFSSESFVQSFCSPFSSWWQGPCLFDTMQYLLFLRVNFQCRGSLKLCWFFLQRWGYEFAPPRSSLTSVSDHVMTSQDCTEF